MSEEGNQTELIILTPGERIALYENAKPILAGKLEYNKEKNEYKVTNPNKLDEDVVPLVHSEVIGKVIKVNSKMAEVQILAVGETPLVRSFKGTIRKENVRAFEIDQIEMFDCFRLGDVVRCIVAALGGFRSYELSTARNDLGVIHAISQVSGETMYPISWEEMICPISNQKERRKVAQC